MTFNDTKLAKRKTGRQLVHIKMKLPILKILILVIIGLLFTAQDSKISNHFNTDSFTALTGENEHNCCMWAAISDSIADSVCFNQLLEYPNSLKYLSESSNPDGWGIVYYQDYGDSAIIERGAVRAFNDPGYDSVVVQIDSLKPKIMLAHIRNCASGCCCHDCDSIANPHPFWRIKNNKCWTFEHNGSVDKSILYELIGDEYLQQNPPSGSGIPECDPSDTSNIVDSELYFLYLLKHIEENNWHTIDALTESVFKLVSYRYFGVYNFVLSDGYTIWAFRKGALLYYLHDTDNNYTAVATIPPSEALDDWQQVQDYEFVVLNAGYSPVVINPSYIPGDINGDKLLTTGDVIFGVNYLTASGLTPPDSCFNDSTGLWLYSAGDVNGNCMFIGSDITYLVNYFSERYLFLKWCPHTPPVDLTGQYPNLLEHTNHSN